MIQWSIDIKSTSIKSDFEVLRDSLSKYTLKSADIIWDSPKEIKANIIEALDKFNNGETKQIHIVTNLDLKIDDQYIKTFYEEIDRIIE